MFGKKEKPINSSFVHLADDPENVFTATWWDPKTLTKKFGRKLRSTSASGAYFNDPKYSRRSTKIKFRSTSSAGAYFNDPKYHT